MAPKPTKNKRLIVLVEDKVHDRVDRAAKRLRISIGELVRQAVEEWLHERRHSA